MFNCYQHILIAASLFLVYYNSIKYDFQAQGRYLFPVLVPLGVSLAVLYKYNRKQKYVIHILLVLLIFIWINSTEQILDNYL